MRCSSLLDIFSQIYQIGNSGRTWALWCNIAESEETKCMVLPLISVNVCRSVHNVHLTKTESIKKQMFKTRNIIA